MVNNFKSALLLILISLTLVIKPVIGNQLLHMMQVALTENVLLITLIIQGGRYTWVARCPHVALGTTLRTLL